MKQEVSERPMIVVVDNEPDVVTTILHLLRRCAEGCEIVVASDGDLALQVGPPQQIMLVITDYLIPKLDGLQVSAILHSWAPQARIIMMTAMPTPELNVWKEIAGIDTVLPKPLPVEILEQIVRDTLAQWQREVAVAA